MPQGGETPGIEQLPHAPERAIESPGPAAFEAPQAPAERPMEPVPAAPAPAASAAAHPPAPPKDEALKRVEGILEEGLADVYRGMDAARKARFSREGDRAAGRLAEMVRKAKVRAREALGLITRWLRIIPKVNRFFLDQEAKIKTDKLIALAEDEKAKRGLL